MNINIQNFNGLTDQDVLEEIENGTGGLPVMWMISEKIKTRVGWDAVALATRKAPAGHKHLFFEVLLENIPVASGGDLVLAKEMRRCLWEIRDKIEIDYKRMVEIPFESTGY